MPREAEQMVRTDANAELHNHPDIRHRPIIGVQYVYVVRVVAALDPAHHLDGFLPFFLPPIPEEDMEAQEQRFPVRNALIHVGTVRQPTRAMPVDQP
ncbi:hypothetical protein [Streptomyces sp. ME19-01-6]|uniref:hypothetical protein n=1 Tax=Streptomyces sp. ME19-01-6 TaxID=3028686 RepID=UPI0029A8E269|nr:hypothetical protein [Streptomyces sp. ME19-01-6]MDX3234000.1 hypothetical protein [Streptomyces sp. ME19-01-6]